MEVDCRRCFQTTSSPGTVCWNNRNWCAASWDGRNSTLCCYVRFLISFLQRSSCDYNYFIVCRNVYTKWIHNWKILGSLPLQVLADSRQISDGVPRILFCNLGILRNTSISARCIERCHTESCICNSAVVVWDKYSTCFFRCSLRISSTSRNPFTF